MSGRNCKRNYDKETYHHRSKGDSKHNRPKCTQLSCDAQVSFCVPLSFDQELTTNSSGQLVPLSTVATNKDRIRGVLKLKFNSSLSKAAYALYVFNATNPQNRITDAHLHLGSSSTNGDVVVDLYNGQPRNVNGLLSSGIITNNNIIFRNVEGFPVTNSVASLYQAIRQSALYVNVHSEQFPGGVIRGQIFTNQK